MKPSTVECCDTALAALNRAQDEGKPFALALLDVDLLNAENAIALARQIELHPSLSPRIVLMLRPDNRRNPCADDLGASICLTKPISPSDLLHAIMAVFDWKLEQEEPSAVVSTATSSEHSALRILLAEDNEINQKVAVGILKRHGHSITVAENGQLALRALEQEAFDLVLMDVQMPVMTGFEAVALIRKQEQATGAHIPIIAMTAHAMQGDRQRCLDAGMDRYLAKPIRAKELFQTIESLMSDFAEVSRGVPIQ